MQKITRLLVAATIEILHKPFWTYLPATILIWMLSVIIPARSASMQLPENDTVGLGTAFAGVGSSAQTPATAFENPAGLVKLPGMQVSLGGIFIRPQVSVSGTAQSGLGSPILGSTQTDAGRTAVVPNAFASYKIGSDLAVGLAITSPIGTSTIYQPDWVGRYSAYKTDIQTININPSAAYQVNHWLSIGAGFSIQQMTTTLSQAINASSIVSTLYQARIGLPDGFVQLKQDDIGFGYNLGALVEPLPGTRLGLTYRSQVDHLLKGEVDFSAPVPLSTNPAFNGGPAQTKFTTPSTARLSITQAMGASWSGYADATWTDWSRLKTLSINRSDGEVLSTIVRNYKNTFSLAVGASVQATDRLTLRAGAAYDQSPIRDEARTLREPDADRYWLSVGASYGILTGTTLDVAFAHIFMPSIDLLDRSQTGDIFKGRSRSSVDLFGLGIRSIF